MLFADEQEEYTREPAYREPQGLGLRPQGCVEWAWEACANEVAAANAPQIGWHRRNFLSQ
jgi:hypothetical protein